MSKRKPHSAEYFGESRDFWWNADYLKLLAKRIRLNRAKKILDVGCGIGHWGQLLAPLLRKDARVMGVDREEAWIAKATERARKLGLARRYRYQIGDVMKLSFPDDQFDLVTCQTVLIHLKDPKAGLREMLRVLKPGGLLFVAEPNNFANRATFGSLSEKLSVDEITEGLRCALILERGKQALGLGFNSVGELVPGYLAEVGATEIQVYLSDKAAPLFPPYSSAEQQVNIRQLREWVQRKFLGWDDDELRDYFLAGGGNEKELARYRERLARDAETALAAIDAGTYHGAGGALTYVVAARKAG